MEEFTAEKWTALAQVAVLKCQPPFRFNPEHFFLSVQDMMRMGMAQAWSNEEETAFLVALFFPNMFSGDPVALNLFWVGAAGQASLDLLRQFQTTARERGCTAVYGSAFRNYRTESMTRLFRRLGYAPHEAGFIKML